MDDFVGLRSDDPFEFGGRTKDTTTEDTSVEPSSDTSEEIMKIHSSVPTHLRNLNSKLVLSQRWVPRWMDNQYSTAPY